MKPDRCNWTRLALMVCMALVLTACSKGTADLQAYIADVKSRPGPPLDPLPVMRQFETFDYAAQDLRDPFSNPRQNNEGSSTGVGPDPNRRKELLESFPLDGLTMVGSLGSGAGMVALVVDPEKVVHRVKAGNYMGQNEGRILAVSESKIDLMELFPDGAGGWEEREAAVALEEQ
ncbi:MAG: pilus assembly protein PilP [Xanthomonadales bacterium]|nr:pilus assembly protein PilP [Xanthomonadales bacterium]